ncbi:hypothetical protein Moror_5951 [Moniliophthora roreri MCA 2997]|uniref:Uncharacterized protein n=2 Tax=Moniliophthora roreri TaxID=221103 RepID=V2Y134_MONRO|nr:hypothetical protein Moror_5951 [Moniliophthora roreri MCA 2997]
MAQQASDPNSDEVQIINDYSAAEQAEIHMNPNADAEESDKYDNGRLENMNDDEEILSAFVSNSSSQNRVNEFDQNGMDELVNEEEKARAKKAAYMRYYRAKKRAKAAAATTDDNDAEVPPAKPVKKCMTVGGRGCGGVTGLKSTQSGARGHGLQSGDPVDAGDVDDIEPPLKCPKSDKSQTATPKDVLSLTMYIEILPYDLLFPKANSKKNVPLPTPVNWGPIMIIQTNLYEVFQTCLAISLPTKHELLPLDKMFWHQQGKPKMHNAHLGGEVAYAAMINVFVEGQPKIRKFVVLTMLPPDKDRNAVDWVTRDSYEDDNKFNYMPFNKENVPSASVTKQHALKLKYKVGNHHLFLGKCIYTTSDSIHYELDDIKLSIWAANLAREKPGVDLNNLPMDSAYFNHHYCIRPATTTSTTITPDSTVSTPAAPITPIYTPPQLTSSQSDIVNVMLLNVLQQQQQFNMMTANTCFITNHPSDFHTFVSPTHHAPPLPPPKAMSAPPSPVKHAWVSLNSFCIYYGLSNVIRD